VLELQLHSAATGDLELFLNGAYAPDDQFTVEYPGACQPGDEILLRDANNVRLAIFRVSRTSGTLARGTVTPIETPRHADFRALRQTPAQVRKLLESAGGGETLALATMDFLSLADEQAIESHRGTSVIHIIEPGPVDHVARVRAAQRSIELGLDASRIILNLLPYAPSERARLHAALTNYGATRIVEPSPGPCRPEVEAIRSQVIPPRHRQGFCVWFTGLPSAGKSTIAEHLAVRLRERGRTISMLDGDVVRMHLSKGLGFSREDRDTNIRRIGFVASEITRHHGAVICAAVSPYQASRDDARRMVGEDRFFLIYVSTPPAVCEERDVKGFYAKARSGQLTGMTGVDDPYEAPTNAHLVLPTSGTTPEESAERVLALLAGAGFVDPSG